MQIVSVYLGEKKREKYHQFVVCWICPQHSKCQVWSRTVVSSGSILLTQTSNRKRLEYHKQKKKKTVNIS